MLCSDVKSVNVPTYIDVLNIKRKILENKKSNSTVIKHLRCQIRDKVEPIFFISNNKDAWTTHEAEKLWGLSSSSLNTILPWKSKINNYYLTQDLLKLRLKTPWPNKVKSKSPLKDTLRAKEAMHARDLPDVIKMMLNVWQVKALNPDFKVESDPESNRYKSKYYFSYDQSWMKDNLNMRWEAIRSFTNENGVFNGLKFREKFKWKEAPKVFHYDLHEPEKIALDEDESDSEEKSIQNGKDEKVSKRESKPQAGSEANSFPVPLASVPLVPAQRQVIDVSEDDDMSSQNHYSHSGAADLVFPGSGSASRPVSVNDYFSASFQNHASDFDSDLVGLPSSAGFFSASISGPLFQDVEESDLDQDSLSRPGLGLGGFD